MLISQRHTIYHSSRGLLMQDIGGEITIQEVFRQSFRMFYDSVMRGGWLLVFLYREKKKSK